MEKRLKLTIDPIIKFRTILNKDQNQFGVSLRKSGHVDFYWNYFRVSSSETYDSSTIHDDVDMSFDSCYLKEAGSGFFKEIKHTWAERIGIEVARQDEVSKLLNFEQLFQLRIKNHVNFYHTYCLINTSFIVVHNKKIFVYDILKEKWMKSFHTHSKVIKVFRNEISQGSFSVGILLENNMFSMLVNQDTESSDPS